MMRCLIVGVALALGSMGCGENGPPAGPPLGQPSLVHGKVTLAGGGAVRGGVITFTPVEIQVGRKLRYEGAGLINAKGEYKAGMNGNGAGLVPGEYKVSVAPREVGEVSNSNTSRIPKQFRDSTNTPLKVTIEEKDNTVNIVLK